jgi:hypothetical protein
METQSVRDELRATRARIRALLIPDPVTGQIEADVFPRSAVMRFVFNPHARKLAFTAVSLGAMFAGRRAAAAGSVWPLVTRSFSNIMERVRH